MEELSLSPALAEKIASYSLQDPNSPDIELGQAKHRIDLINAWSLPPGSRVLEIGCGQGNCTAVIAEAVGPSGHVDAIDPAPGDYGAPFTLEQAQAFMSSGPVGGRISWHRAEPVEFLKDNEGKWDAAVLAHCIWYFSSSAVLEETLTALKGRVQRVLIAEYALHSTQPSSVPHLLASMARATLEAHKANSTENIRTLLSPREIQEIANKTGWRVDKEKTVVPQPGLYDGFWEAGAVASGDFLQEVESEVSDPRVAGVLRAERSAVVAAAERIGGLKSTTTMDVWAGVLVAEES